MSGTPSSKKRKLEAESTPSKKQKRDAEATPQGSKSSKKESKKPVEQLSEDKVSEITLPKTPVLSQPIAMAPRSRLADAEVKLSKTLEYKEARKFLHKMISYVSNFSFF